MAYRRRRKRNPAWVLPVVIVGGVLAVGTVLFIGRQAMAKGNGKSKFKPKGGAGGVVEIAEDAWGGERISVPLNTTIKTVGWTFFPDATFGVLVDRLADKGASLKVEKDSQGWAGGPGGLSGHHDITLFTGSSSGPVEMRLQSSLSGDDRTELKLQLGG